MSGVHLHLLLNHIPIIGTIGALLLLIWGMASGSEEIRRVAMVSFVVVGLLTIPVYATGDPAADAVGKLPGVTRAAIEEHDEAALFGIIAASIDGALALVALFVAKTRPHLTRRFTIGLLVVALWATSVLARVSYLGGLIRHSEIRPASAATR